ncbi:restriction endonuclease subunit S [Streptococcus uberis]|uniref:restriction endonuclease subunit S n=1 Tax=Streptococcus uberis TaxID=1349 RepID=UPI0020BF9ED2|nr:restriction endonuclease subunit S [Streptococcus uberis]
MKYKAFLLEELTNAIFSGGTPSKSIKEYWNGDINWLSSGETRNNFIYQTDNKITSLGVEKSSTRKAQKGNVVIASAGQGKTRGQVSFLKIDTFINQSIIAIEVNNNLLDEKYLFYNLKSRYRELRSISDSASVRGSLTTKMFKNLKIDIPSLKYQKKISKILYTLDSKIEVNNKIIDNLEQQAQAIFKSWFIDFEPFQDSEFVDSELGPIPKGFGVKKVKEICEIKIGRTPSRKQSEWFSNKSGIKWVSIKDMGNSKIFISETSEYLTSEAIKKFNIPMVEKGTLLLSFKLTVGRISIAQDTMTTNEAIANFSKTTVNSYYLYYVFKNLNFNSLGNTSSIGNAVNSSIIKDISILVPNQELLEKFIFIITPIMEMISNLIFQNQKLAATRDLLLPKLMSGELDVSDLDI